MRGIDSGRKEHFQFGPDLRITAALCLILLLHSGRKVVSFTEQNGKDSLEKRYRRPYS